MGKRDKTPPAAAPPTAFNPALAKLRERLPEGWSPPEAEAGAGARPEPGPPRAVVRIERKGRGGKEATVVEKLALSTEALARWADELKRTLGCGGAVEGDAIALQGDQRERVTRWLVAKGVRKVVAG